MVEESRIFTNSNPSIRATEGPLAILWSCAELSTSSPDESSSASSCSLLTAAFSIQENQFKIKQTAFFFTQKITSLFSNETSKLYFIHMRGAGFALNFTANKKVRAREAGYTCKTLFFSRGGDPGWDFLLAFTSKDGVSSPVMETTVERSAVLSPTLPVLAKCRRIFTAVMAPCSKIIRDEVCII